MNPEQADMILDRVQLIHILLTGEFEEDAR